MKSRKSRRTTGAWCAVVAMLVLAGCGGSSDPEPKAAKEDATPETVTLADLTDEPSVKIEYPTIDVPDGTDPLLVDWMVQQLLPAAQRSLDVEELSRRDEARATNWVVASYAQAGDVDRASQVRSNYGPGYSFLFGTRFAEDSRPTGPVHVLGHKWESEKKDGKLHVRVILELAVPFDDGVAVITRELRQSASLGTDVRTALPSYGASVRTLGLTQCSRMTKDGGRPGDLSKVAERLDELTDRKEEGGLSAWALKETTGGAPTKQEREECAAGEKAA